MTVSDAVLQSNLLQASRVIREPSASKGAKEFASEQVLILTDLIELRALARCLVADGALSPPLFERFKHVIRGVDASNRRELD